VSTNGIIARSTGERTFVGRYHHWDSYPSGLGVALVDLYRGHFKRDLTRMLHVLLDEHPAGWSTIVHKDFALKPGFTNIAQRPEGMSIEEFQNRRLNRRPQCYCHGHRHEEGWIADEKSDCGAEWAYVFETISAHDDESERKILHVLYPEKNQSGEYGWKEAGQIDLDSTDEISWTTIECGENFERCSHMAWYHGVVPKTCNLGMQTWLGNRPLDPIHDPVAYVIDGKKYKATGSGGSSDYIRGHHPCGTWVASLVTGNNRRTELPIARYVQHEGRGEYQLLDNVQAIYPPLSCPGENRDETF
jgi:hypothetical protein